MCLKVLEHIPWPYLMLGSYEQARKRAYRRWKGLKYFQVWLTDEIADPHHEELSLSDFTQIGSVELKILMKESFWLIWIFGVVSQMTQYWIWFLSSMGTRQKWSHSNRFSKTEVMDHLNQMLKKKGGGGGELEFADVDRRALREAPVKI